MRQVVIENPVINSPFEEPKRHFRFTNEDITNEIVQERRECLHFDHPCQAIPNSTRVWPPGDRFFTDTTLRRSGW